MPLILKKIKKQIAWVTINRPEVLNAMNESVKFHYEKSEEFRKLCDNRNFSPDKEFLIQEIPFLPVSLFKTFQLKSVPDSDIIKTVYLIWAWPFP